MLQRRPAPARARPPPPVSDDSADDAELPQCKIRRNYNCSQCTFYTQNPRAHLVHVRDVHFQKIKIYDCPHCVYASRHHQKLLRHVKMVHVPEQTPAPPARESVSPENMEDLLEEVEDSSDAQEDETEEASRHAAEDEPSGARGDKDKFFSCNICCNYVTHLKSRYTKHVKYHSMPMIKCALCDFRTPYKWNLDRHMKNHGGGGAFCCSMCNFTADIKQSLTVHEMNHHTPAPAARTRDLPSGDEREEYGSLHSDMTEMLSCNNDSNETSSKGDDDLLREDEPRARKKARPIPQLIPLNSSTPNQTKAAYEPPQKKLRESITPTLEIDNDEYIESVTSASALAATKHDNAPKKKNESFFDKLKERLLTETGKEGSLTCKDCGFQSKCLSEHSVHENNCSAQGNRQAANSSVALGSTRCQNCRHRCKSSADLYVHMQTCSINDKTDTDTAHTKDQKPNNEKVEKAEGGGPHPMENVVFVWNTIDSESSKFDNPLDISIQEDATLPPSAARAYDPNNVDALHDNEGANLSPTQTVGKKVYKCPHCPFWASTASRFHVHIVGHLNRKPFECSLCQYKSNWRWDITKHIKLKSARSADHGDAKVLMTDETGRRNYSKYNKFLAILKLDENGGNEFQYIDTGTSSVDPSIELDESEQGPDQSVAPLNLQTHPDHVTASQINGEDKKPKKTLWKCKKCNYKDSSKEALLVHVREHSRSAEGSPEERPVPGKDPSDLAYRCGHCNQLSNWKHVIQRHCRLKHDGVIKVIATEKPKHPDPQTQVSLSDANDEFCPKCPFSTSDKKLLTAHLQQHAPSPQGIFKCYFCYYFARTERELLQHLVLHGAEPEGGPAPLSKRHRCAECPYETNSRSQFMYHEQFHRLPADTPYKCRQCNYSVSKRHLLHQHMRVHGAAFPRRDDDSEHELSGKDDRPDEEIPYVWVAAKNEFHKMYKCRYCSYVNSQNCKIPTHEKVHLVFFDDSESVMYKCLECKYTCDTATRLSDHSRSHSEIYGRIYFNVETDVADEEQIAKLREVIEEERKMDAETAGNREQVKGCDRDKVLYFCQKCPSRFFTENELKIHERFHDLIFSFKCKLCEYSVPQEPQLSAHAFVHSDEYQEKTRVLKTVHDAHPDHKETTLELAHCPRSAETSWVVPRGAGRARPAELGAGRARPAEPGPRRNGDGKHVPKQYYCTSCPAKFFKNSALSYHKGLHGGEGDHRCKTCDYTVKNIGNLAKHEALHEKKAPNVDYESGDDVDFKNVPLSGTDLFQRKTEAQKRVYIDKDKLVKPNDHFPPKLQADPQFGYLMHGNPEFIYPTYMKNGRQKEKRYKCHKCPSAFEKREQYKIHLSLHGSKQRYKCELCDYSVKYYANYVQHMRKHQMNDEAVAERNKGTDLAQEELPGGAQGVADTVALAAKTIPRSVVKSDFQQFSVSDQQTLRLLQRRRSASSAGAEPSPLDAPPAKERRLHLCALCPYGNQRQDALNNHYKRHDNLDVSVLGSHRCSHCDLTVIQSHFLRDHMKSHFNLNKPQCYSANTDVKFTIQKLEDEDSSIDVMLNSIDDTYESTADKIYVQIATGEISVQH